jgi:gamma-glutamyl-gamma-aminobutyrate hydrolase PuuD
MSKNQPNKRTVYVIGGSKDYANWMQAKIINDMEKADLVVLTGGEDVDPSWYKKDAHPFTSSNIERDYFEVKEFQKALKLKKHMIGICRGAQLMCVMNGGILVQHQANPYFLHRLHTFDDKEGILTTSLHHQAAFPFDLPKDRCKILAWTNGISSFHYSQSWREELNPPQECEIVFYPESRCLGIQGHPEIMFGRNKQKDFSNSIRYYQELLDKHLNNEL